MRKCPKCGESYIRKLGSSYLHVEGKRLGNRWHPGKACLYRYGPNNDFKKWIVKTLSEGVMSRNEILERGEAELGLAQSTVKTYHVSMKQQGLIVSAEVPVGGNPRRGYWQLGFVDPVMLVRMKNED